jgi:hypothetical protein
MYDILMLAEVLMQNDFHFNLLGREAALLECMFLIDELDGDDGLGSIVGYCFADAVHRLLAYLGFIESGSTHEAYAPWPIVLLTSRKGRLDGKGATWLYVQH